MKVGSSKNLSPVVKFFSAPSRSPSQSAIFAFFVEKSKIGGAVVPRHVLRDRDGAFGPAYTRRIRAMRIRDHPTPPCSPWQNGHVERLIGSIRHESLDHLIVFEEPQLRRVLKNYASYYSQIRTHFSLD